MKELIKEAILAREFAYAPYSNFKVGASILTKNKKIYKGCNIENASYSLTNCAERTAIFKAISEGERDFLAIAIIGAKDKEKPLEYCAPCGSCLQVISEFCNTKDFKIILVKDEDDYLEYTLEQMLPFALKNKNL